MAKCRIQEALEYFKKGAELGNEKAKLNYEWAIKKLRIKS